MVSLKEWLEKRGDRDPLTRYLLANGREYRGQKLPKPYRLRSLKNCYWNARDLVTGSKGKLRYCEGLVLCLDLGLLYPIDHAWAVDADDNVIDPTIAKDGESRSDACLYLGVVIELKKGERLFGGYGSQSPLYQLINSTIEAPEM